MEPHRDPGKDLVRSLHQCLPHLQSLSWRGKCGCPSSDSQVVMGPERRCIPQAEVVDVVNEKVDSGGR